MRQTDNGTFVRRACECPCTDNNGVPVASSLDGHILVVRTRRLSIRFMIEPVNKAPGDAGHYKERGCNHKREIVSAGQL